MRTVAYVLVAIPFALLGYAYLAYPALLKLAGAFRPTAARRDAPDEWPQITITVPCYNEARSIAATIESLLALDYPADRRQILIISDASTDATDDIVRSYASRGVELLRLPARRGKTAAENAAAVHCRGEIVVNTDATIRILPGSLRALIAVFQDPTIGVASGRDVSVGDVEAERNHGESGYVGYEMWIRSLETRLGGIVGASGCFFANRLRLYDDAFPEELSRDFASCLIAREHGYRSVSVDAACALVPRAPSLRAEYRRKVRTMARGLGTLRFKRQLLNPLRYGGFAVMLFSHKLCRWLFQLTMPLLAPAALLLSYDRPACAPWILGGAVLLAAAAATAWWWPEGRRMPRVLSAPGYFLWSNLAGLVAWIRFFRGQYQPVWEPTRRPAIRA
jgi:cellulose synthase/poly-beta-1,6-N-acetylglucosamine synthase-like glycosyltransferase